MKPADVIETIDRTTNTTDANTGPLTTWTRNGASVSFYPNINPATPEIRARQERDVVRHLEEREQQEQS